jgi:hypothetical protein
VASAAPTAPPPPPPAVEGPSPDSCEKPPLTTSIQATEVKTEVEQPLQEEAVKGEVQAAEEEVAAAPEAKVSGQLQPTRLRAQP